MDGAQENQILSLENILEECENIFADDYDIDYEENIK